MMGEVFNEILCAQACDRSEKCIRRIMLDGYLWHKEQGEKLSPLCKMYMGDTKDCKYYIELDEWANQ